MHCKMPSNVKVVKVSGPGEPPNMPVSPHGLPIMPAPFPGPIPAQLPGPMAVTGPFPGAMPMPFPVGPPVKLPVIVMPLYSPDPSFKKTKLKGTASIRSDADKYINRNIKLDIDTSSSSDTARSSDTSSEGGFWGETRKRGWKKGHKGFERSSRRFNKRFRAKRKRHQKKDYLTPVLQYVTKDGYVIYEKKISKGEAKDWLNEENVADTNTSKSNHEDAKDIKPGRDRTIADVKNSENNKNKYVKITRLKSDYNNDEKQVRVTNIKKSRNKNKIFQNRDLYSSDESSDDKVKRNDDKLEKPKFANKGVIGKLNRRRS